MTVATLLVRNHNALAKACLGGGFAFGFAYTNNTGTSPIRDAASAAGTSSPPRPKFELDTIDRRSRATRRSIRRGERRNAVLRARSRRVETHRD